MKVDKTPYLASLFTSRLSWAHNPWILAVGVGLLLSLSFPPVNASFLSFIGFIGLYQLVLLSHNYRHLALISYPAFLVWNLGTTYWLIMASIPAGVAAIVANSAVMLVPMMVIRFFHHRYRLFGWTALIQAATWVLYEYLHHHWDLAWPWLSVGNAWANHTSLIQYISVSGHLGISFWVVFGSFLCAHWLLMSKKKARNTALLVLGFILPPLASMVLFGISSQELQEIKGNRVNVVVVQPNHDSYQDYGGMSGTEEVLDSLFSLSLAQKKAGTELIVWPENAIDKPIQMDSRHAVRIADSARAWQTNFIIGTGLYTLYPDQAPELYRSSVNGVRYNAFNSTLFADSSGQLSRYDKAQLVPFVERFPFVEFLSKVDVFNLVDWGTQAGFGRGDQPSMLRSSSGFISPGLVCYDSVFPSWNRAFVREGAQILTIITNDGWWGNSSGHLQHFAYARLRAIEFRRWVIRSANNGTSGIISPDGSVQNKTQYWTRTSFDAEVPLRNDLSFYALWGDWLAMLCFFLVLLSVGYGWVTRKKP